MVTPSKPPPPYKQLLPLPTPCFKKFLERSLNDPPPPHFKHLSLLPPPHPPPLLPPLKILIIHEAILSDERPSCKTRINQLQKQVNEDLKVESLVSWEKFSNSISLESNPNESWRKIKNFLKPKGQRDCPALRHANKVTKTNADKAQLFAVSVERHFGIESDQFDSSHFDEVNKFIEDNRRYFYPPEDPDDYRFDVGNEHEYVADVDTQTLIKLVKFLKKGKAPGPDTIHNEVLRLGTTTSLFHHLARLFTSSIQLGYIPTAWKLASVCY